MVCRIDGCSLGLFFCFSEVVVGRVVPMHSFKVLVLFEQSQEIGNSKYEPIVVYECLGCDFLINLLLSSCHILDIVD